MSSIEGYFDHALDDFLSAIGGDSVEEFAANATRWAYIVNFCAKFATYSPTAWVQLLELGAPFRAAIHSGQMELLDEVYAQVWRSCLAWATHHKVHSPDQWVTLFATSTLFRISWNEYIGDPAPTTLMTTVITGGIVSRVDGQLIVTTPTFRPESDITFRVDVGEQVWRQTRETWSEFRTRALKEFGALLDAQRQQLGAEAAVMTPKTADVDQLAVEWLIRHRVNGESINAIAKTWKDGDQRKPVREAIRMVAGVLGLE